MIVVTNTIQIKKGYGAQIAERFKNPKGVHTMPGFVKMELLLSENGDEADELKVMTTWVDKASFDNWVNSDSFKEAHARRSPAGADAGQPAGQHSAGQSAAEGVHAAEQSGPAGEHPAGQSTADGVHAAGQPGPAGRHPAGQSRGPAVHAAEQSGGPGGHPAGRPHSAGQGAVGAAAGPGPVMLGSKLSIHELLFTQEAAPRQ